MNDRYEFLSQRIVSICLLFTVSVVFDFVLLNISINNWCSYLLVLLAY